MPTVQNRITTGIGLRHVRIAQRASDGTFVIPTSGGYAPAAAKDPYQGIWHEGAIRMTLNLPEPRRVTARGDDRGYYTFQLPPEEQPTGELAFTKTHMDVLSLVSDTLVFGSPPVRKVGLATSKLGYEPSCFVRGSREAVDTQEGSTFFGNQVWQTYLMLNVLLAHRPMSFEDGAVGEFIYPLAANDSVVDEMGVTFTAAVNGFTKAPYLMAITEGKFGLDAFLGDGDEDTFELSYGGDLLSGSPVLVSKDGVIQSIGWSLVAGTIVFNTPPADGAKIMVEYEYED